MLRQMLFDPTADQKPALSFKGPPTVWNPSASTARRRWPFALADFITGRKTRASRLMATVHTDMVEYSRLFALDDTGTVARLRNLRRGLIARALRHHQGRLVQTAGDSMLLTFSSVTQAVRCAVSIQHELALWNAVWPEDRRMRLRIGVDLGDVITDGRDFHGDGVIIAARLQALCPPGAVCISRAVHERGGDRLGLPSECLGPLVLKNVMRPVEAFVLWPSPYEMATAPRLLA